MSLLIFKVSDYNNTAEREQYRTICNHLKTLYSRTDDLCIFVANFEIYGSELDCIIIKNDAIIAVEFKNYGGKIIATENGEWKTGDGTVIKGGARKSVYKQARINRSNLMNGLRDSGFIAPKNLRNISSLIIFNQPIELDMSGISGKVRSWLHVCDNEHFLEKVQDITSSVVDFSNGELVQLVSKLNLDGGGDFVDDRFSDPWPLEIEDMPEEFFPEPQALTISSLTTNNQLLSLTDSLPSVSDSQIPAYIGIDFGTSTTVVSVSRLYDGRMTCKTVAIGFKTIDGAVGKDDRIATMLAFKDGKLLAGRGAEEFKYDLEKDVNIWYSFKMQLGEDLGDQYAKSLFPQIKSPKDATKLFFKYLKTQIERCVPASRYEYAVTIPASFEANQRKDLIEALESNGININRQSLIDEPNAAFLSNIMEDQQHSRTLKLRPDGNLKVLVFDYGAGTCDVSILELGLNQKGAFSKNLAISRFEKCGGDDIDRCIAKTILLPQLLKSMDMKESDLRRKQVDYLVKHLMKPAELLKIEICEKVSNQMEDGILPPLASSDEEVALNYPVEFEFDEKMMHLDSPKMKFSEFNNVMRTFLKQDFSEKDKYNSVFKSINSAIEKSGYSRSDIDYVLLIGGSSYNPYIQYALRENFSESELRIPENLQTHVSQGAAIHSLIYNGLGHNIINPITSEPIMVITKGSPGYRVIVPAGTNMPSEDIVIEDLETSRDGQDIIEMPLCVGSTSKILSNFIITCPNDEGFHLGESIKLKIRLTADKLLKGYAEVRGSTYEIKPLNPLSNKSLSADEMRILQIQRKVYNDASRNEGKASVKSLKDLAQAYKDAGRHLEAAETYEEINDLYPGGISLNNIALEYGEAGQQEKEIQILEKALEEEPNNATIMFNLANNIKLKDPERYKELMEKSITLSPGAPVYLFDFGRWLLTHGESKRGKELIELSLQIWDGRFKNGQMQPWDYNWYISALESVGEYSKANEVRETGKKRKAALFNTENLTKQK